MRDDDVLGWAGGGNWDYDPPADLQPPQPPKPKFSEKELELKFGPPLPPGRASGFICGRFSPPHRGHEYLIETARRSCQRVVVLLFDAPGETLPVALRIRWLQEMFPGVEVLNGGRRPDPAKPDFAETWRGLIHTHVPEEPRFMFTSEAGSEELAKEAGATLVLVDPRRSIVPMSSSEVRQNVLTHFESLHPVVRPYFVRRVAIVGAESAGKSTLGIRLAWDHYGTLCVPEVARLHAERHQGQIAAKDLQLVARSQVGCEDSIARHANRLLFCDTDLLTLRVWSERLNSGMCPTWILEEIPRRPYDLVLVCAPDGPAAASSKRGEKKAAKREGLHERLLGLLQELKAPVCVLAGEWHTRERIACEAADALLARGGFLSQRGAQMVRNG